MATKRIPMVSLVNGKCERNTEGRRGMFAMFYSAPNLQKLSSATLRTGLGIAGGRVQCNVVLNRLLF